MIELNMLILQSASCMIFLSYHAGFFTGLLPMVPCRHIGEQGIGNCTSDSAMVIIIR